jgi:hypothetical protein
VSDIAFSFGYLPETDKDGCNVEWDATPHGLLDLNFGIRVRYGRKLSLLHAMETGSACYPIRTGVMRFRSEADNPHLCGLQEYVDKYTHFLTRIHGTLLNQLILRKTARIVLCRRRL